MSSSIEHGTHVKVWSLKNEHNRNGEVVFTNEVGIKIKSGNETVFYPWTTVLMVKEYEWPREEEG